MVTCLKVKSEEETSDNLQFSPDDISLESCVQCSKPDDAVNSCYLHIEAQSGHIHEVLLVSECRRVEAYQRVEGEYLGTFSGPMIEDASDEDMKVFAVRIILSDDKALPSCSMKLTGINNDSFWILSLQVKTKKCLQETKDVQKRFDFNAVQSLLGDAELTDKAKDFKMLFENFQATKPPSLDNFQQSSAGANLLSVLDRRLRDVETRLHDRITEIEKRQNEKLDKIIALLEKH
jgi:hypothetical protein